MTLSAFNILIIIAIILTVCSMLRPQWPLLSVAVLLIAVALLAGQHLLK